MNDEPIDVPETWRDRLRRWQRSLHNWYRPRRFYLWLAGFVFMVVILSLSRSIFYTVPAGHAGVVFRRFLGGTQTEYVRDEGMQVIFPWDILTIYDVRIQQVSHSFTIISHDGLEVGITLSIRYRPKIELLGILHKEVGVDYVNKIIIPEIQALVRTTFGAYTPEEMYTTKRSLIEQTLNSAATQIGDRYVALDDLLVKEIKLPTNLQAAIENKLVEQQNAFAMEFRIARERQEAERKAIEANGVAKFNATVGPGLTEDLLRYRGIEATLKLAESHNAKVVVIGDRNGLPVILDTNTGSAAAPLMSKPPAPAQPPTATPTAVAPSR